MTKKLLSLLLPLTFLCFASCEEDESVDPSLMPAATTVGANTFGCLIDGWVYTSGRFGLPKVTDESTPDESCFHYLCSILAHHSGELLFIKLSHQANPNASDRSIFGNRMPKSPLLQKVTYQVFRVGAGLWQHRLHTARRTDRNR